MRSHYRTHRYYLFIVLLLLLLLLSQDGLKAVAGPPSTNDGSVAGDPFVVFVAQEEAYTRCGPANDFYRADPLRYGQELEVYVETADGWLGVRPPENSFCWIPADAVELARDSETAVVIEDGTVAWIGTHLGRAREYRWQVQLAKGEPVTILGRSEREGPDGPRLWFRMVPPSGEFRWVHNKQVVSNAEALVAAVRQQTVNDIEFLPGGKRESAAQQTKYSVAQQQPKTSPPQKQTPPPANKSNLLEIDEEVDNHATAATGTTKNSSRRSDRNTSLQPIAFDDIPKLTAAPELPPHSGVNANFSEPIGSGLRTPAESTPQSNAAVAEPASLAVASAEFIGRPKIKDIDQDAERLSASLLGSTNHSASTPPSGVAQADDSNWVIGSKRERGEQAIAQVSGQLPFYGPSQSQPIARNETVPARLISPETIARIESEVENQTMEQLNLTFSRFMASSASSAEVAPLANRARRLVHSQSDQVAAGRARLLAERIEQYRSIADRRDGQAVLQTSTTQAPVIQNVGPTLPPTTVSATASNNDAHGANLGTQAGFLVQVYSARKDSPPFALTDQGGRTVAYVTPSPGVNLRMHLNSEIQVRGVQTYLRGLNTPHLIVSEVSRNLH